MTPIAAFVLGLLVGWLIEWVIDWVYWRQRRESVDECREKVSALEAELSASKNEIHSLEEKINSIELEKAHLEALAQDAQRELDATRAKIISLQPPAPDNLEEIIGIGPVIAGKLNAAGIYTFEQLAAVTPEFLRANLGDAIQRLADEESLIEQARLFAQQKQNKGTSGR